MVAESIQRDGEVGLQFTKRWLESTTWIDLPFDVYSNATVCTMERLDGKKKRFDAFGSIHTDPPTPLLIENKAYNSTGGKQSADYWEFLANAYSITAKSIANGLDARYEFMWVTTHPFEMTAWNKLTTPARIEKALDKDPAARNNKPADANILSLVSDRIWLLVLRDAQEKLMLTAGELSQVESLLNRKRKP